LISVVVIEMSAKPIDL